MYKILKVYFSIITDDVVNYSFIWLITLVHQLVLKCRHQPGILDFINFSTPEVSRFPTFQRDDEPLKMKLSVQLDFLYLCHLAMQKDPGHFYVAVHHSSLYSSSALSFSCRIIRGNVSAKLKFQPFNKQAGAPAMTSSST